MDTAWSQDGLNLFQDSLITNLSLWIFKIFLEKLTQWYLYVYILICLHLGWTFDSFSFSVQNQILRVRLYKRELMIQRASAIMKI